MRVSFSVGVVVALVGCARPGGPEGTAGTKADGRPRVALVMKSLANEFFATMADGARAHQAGRSDRYELIVNGMRNETDVSEQVTLIEQMVACGRGHGTARDTEAAGGRAWYSRGPSPGA